MPDSWLLLGWDVGGWMGRKQGAAALSWRGPGTEPTWLGIPSSFSLPKRGLLSPEELLDQTSQAASLTDFTRSVVAVDAPLGYPKDFVELVRGEGVSLSKPHQEIESRLAYRDTERHIYRVFGKKPLSAPFDKLGNNASVAVAHVRSWCNAQGFVLQPNGPRSAREIIEVYPALTKTKEGKARDAVRRFIPSDLVQGSDAYDAAICAILALAFAAEGSVHGLPQLQGPSEDPGDEAWIYHILPGSLGG